MGLLKTIKDYATMLKQLRKQHGSAENRRREWQTGWSERMNPIDLAVLEATVANRVQRTEMTRNLADPADVKALKEEDTRKKVKPIDVLKEIVADKKPVFKIADVEHQIEVIENRVRVLKEQGIDGSMTGNVGDENRALSYLRARRTYSETHELFKWPTTTQPMVLDLLKKYKLHVVELSEFSRYIPKEAIDAIEQFGNACKKVNEKMVPDFRLVIDDEGFKEVQKMRARKEAEKKKKDPILLALSPFGDWYYILGAWDKEVEFLDDLIYHGK